MKIGIYYNSMQVERGIADSLADTVIGFGGQACVFSAIEEIPDCDRILVLGGDGTILRAAKRASELRIPLIGVNFGRLGFLTEYDREDAVKAAELVLRADCPLLERSMLEAEVNGVKHFCLNEIALLRGVSPAHENNAVNISVTIDGTRAGDFYADGLIVSTPTGSTAYSLSAGGSIMTPECNTFQLTPVCAFSLKSRPIAYPDRCELRFVLPKGNKLVLCGDGVSFGEVGSGDEIAVRKASRTASFLTKNKSEYFRRLTEKIN